MFVHYCRNRHAKASSIVLQNDSRKIGILIWQGSRILDEIRRVWMVIATRGKKKMKKSDSNHGCNPTSCWHFKNGSYKILFRSDLRSNEARRIGYACAIQIGIMSSPPNLEACLSQLDANRFEPECQALSSAQQRPRGSRCMDSIWVSIYPYMFNALYIQYPWCVATINGFAKSQGQDKVNPI